MSTISRADEMAGRPAVFLDRDGTVIDDVAYLSRLEDIRPVPGVSESLRKLREIGYAVVLVTNQSGVARGYFDEVFVQETHRVLEELLAFRFDGIYYCPHGPDDGCSCRKPSPGMVNTAIEELCLKRPGSYVVGDKAADMELARNAGLQGILVRTGYGQQHSGQTDASYVADDINEACEWIIRRWAQGR